MLISCRKKYEATRERYCAHDVVIGDALSEPQNDDEVSTTLTTRSGSGLLFFLKIAFTKTNAPRGRERNNFKL